MKNIDFAEFVWAWNHSQGLDTPELHVHICRWLAACWHSGKRELLLMAFRSSGKSTLVGLFSVWLLARDPNIRILVMAADLALAKKMVRNVKRIIERHSLTRDLKPKRVDQWASAQFTVNRTKELRDPSMLAKGIGANVTGSRADVIICDDVEVPNTCDSAPKRDDLRERLLETDYVLVPGGLKLFVGTPHTYYSIYNRDVRFDAGEDGVFLDGFKRLELPLLDDRGNSRWPERFPLERVQAIRQRTGENKFLSQMMLQPVNSANGRLDPDRLRYYDDKLIYREGNKEAVLTIGKKRLVKASCWWDPSYGSPQKGDANVVAVVFTDEDGEYWLHRTFYMHHDPKIIDEVAEATQLCRQVVTFLDEFYLPAVTLEINGIGRFLPGLLRRELADAGQPSAVIETSSRIAKDTRIIDAFDAVLADGRLHAHRSVWDTPFIGEMREWRPGAHVGAGRHDDGLDAVSGCLLSEPVRLSRRPTPSPMEVKSRRNWVPGRNTFKATANFNV